MSFHDGTSFKMKKVLMVGYQVEIGIIDIHQQGIGERKKYITSQLVEVLCSLVCRCTVPTHQKDTRKLRISALIFCAAEII